MDGEEVISQLLIGSKEIDRMKQEVRDVISTIMGFMPSPDSMDLRFSLVRFVSQKRDCWWDFDKINSRYEITCAVDREGRGDWMGRTIAFSCSFGNSIKPKVPLTMEFTKAVRKGLPVFVEGMAKNFPDLQKRWQPLLDAAAAAHKRLH